MTKTNDTTRRVNGDHLAVVYEGKNSKSFSVSSTTWIITKERDLYCDDESRDIAEPPFRRRKKKIRKFTVQMAVSNYSYSPS